MVLMDMGTPCCEAALQKVIAGAGFLPDARVRRVCSSRMPLGRCALCCEEATVGYVV